jgi:hypothetical protein
MDEIAGMNEPSVKESTRTERELLADVLTLVRGVDTSWRLEAQQGLHDRIANLIRYKLGDPTSGDPTILGITRREGGWDISVVDTNASPETGESLRDMLSAMLATEVKLSIAPF